MRDAPSLHDEALDDVGSPAEVFAQHLDRHAPLDQRVLCLVHEAHAPLAKHAQDSIAAVERAAMSGSSSELTVAVRVQT